VLALVYMWVVWPADRMAFIAPSMTVLVLFPIVSSVLHRDSPRTLGFRIDNLGRSARELAPVTLAAAAFLVALGLAAGNDFAVDRRVIEAAPTYPLWALLQQYVLQGFVYRRTRESLGRPGWSAATAGVLFGIIHAPNPVLLVAGVVGGFIWCRLYERNPNLFTLALSHGILGLFMRVALPWDWHHALAVGPRY